MNQPGINELERNKNSARCRILFALARMLCACFLRSVEIRYSDARCPADDLSNAWKENRAVERKLTRLTFANTFANITRASVMTRAR